MQFWQFWQFWRSWRRIAITGTGPATATSGGYANTGLHIGDVHLARPLARSAYLAQVRHIAPEELRDRSTELTELAAFCTEADRRAYVWWRAPAWAGKTALLSWFVLNPPERVQIVSFFVTARYAGQSDRIGFTDVVVEQLAELLGQPVPDYVESTRDGHFLHLLAEAADSCIARGERLVLVVDGLDEDRGVTIGPEAHSIAALLPSQPPGGTRIIVTGRPDPPIPSDVLDHPLRDPAIVRILDKSPHAAVVRADAQRELKRLLKGTPTEQDLLGLVTAAHGGLSGPDLAELTGLSVFQVEDHLNTVSGRTFNHRVSQWRPATGPDVYVLGHEELQITAQHMLGPARLEAYRQRLHTWAHQYREQQWPSTTPEYLLRSYYNMLTATNDLTRMTTCATDPARQDLMFGLIRPALFGPRDFG